MDFKEQIKSWDGNKLLVYTPKNQEENEAKQAEIKARLDVSLPKVEKAVIGFLTKLAALK